MDGGGRWDPDATMEQINPIAPEHDSAPVEAITTKPAEDLTEPLLGPDADAKGLEVAAG